MRFDRDSTTRRYERLSRLRDFGVARNDRDPRGWRVVNREGMEVGRVRDVIVDTERMRGTYLDVELDTKRFELADDDPHVLVPVDRARVEGRRLVVDDFSPTWVREMCAARELHHHDFWERWWKRDDARHVESHDLRRVVQDLRPGETARIPVVQEEIIVERRPIARDDHGMREDVRSDEGGRRDDYAVNRAADEPPAERR